MTDPISYIPYPWQQETWLRFQQQFEQGSIPHAILLSGQKGIGKWHFAHSLRNFLLCHSPKSNLACGKCRSCQLLSAGSHPDQKVVTTEDKSTHIKIDQIRELTQFADKTASQGKAKVIIIDPAERLNINAANALLKNLEEPAKDTYFILVSHAVNTVMATIRSRCQHTAMHIPDRELAHQWLVQLNITNANTLLDIAGGAPLVARQMVEGEYLDQLQLFLENLSEVTAEQSTVVDISPAIDWVNIELGDITQWWLQVIHRILTYTYKPDIQDKSNINQAMNHLLSVAKNCNQLWLHKFSDKLIQIRLQENSGANPNKQLLLEELLLDWQRIVQQS